MRYNNGAVARDGEEEGRESGGSGKGSQKCHKKELDNASDK